MLTYIHATSLFIYLCYIFFCVFFLLFQNNPRDLETRFKWINSTTWNKVYSFYWIIPYPKTIRVLVVICRVFPTCDEWWILVGDLPWVSHMWWVVNNGGWSAVCFPCVMSGEYWWVICREFPTCDEWWIMVGDLPWGYHVWWVVNIWWAICCEFTTCDEWWILVSDLSWVSHVWRVVNIGGWSAVGLPRVMSGEYCGWSVMGLPHVMSGEYWWAICCEFPTCDEWWILWVICHEFPMCDEWWILWVICHELPTCDERWILVGDLPWVYHVW